MGADDERKLWLMLGEMKAGIDLLTKQLPEMRKESQESATALHGRITVLATTGCARGDEHARRLEKLEKELRWQRPGRGRHALVGTAAGGGVAGIVLGLVELIRMWMGKG